MATINALSSATRYGNVGKKGPSTDIGNIIGAIIVPKGFEFDVTTPQTTLMAACLNANPLLRAYPIFDFEATKDSSETKTVQTMPTGAKHVVKEGYNDHSFQFVTGAKDLQNALRKFNGADWDFYYIDGGVNGSAQKLLGIAGSTSTKLKAIPTDGGMIWTDTFVLNDATKIADYQVGFVFKKTYLNDLLCVIELPFDAPTTLYGCADINLTGAPDATSGSYDITLLTKSGTNLGDIYPTQMATIGMWTAAKTATGGSIAILTAVYDAVNKWFKIGLDKTDPNYPTTGTVSINLAAPSVLDAAGVKGCESTGSVAITKN